MFASRASLVAWSSRLAVLGACALSGSACGGSSSSPSSPSSAPTQPVASVRYVSVTGDFLISAVGGSTQLRANANTTSGAQDVTGQATWRSSNESVATVSSGGLVSARGAGLATITASYGGWSGAGGIAVATAVNVTGTWTGSSVNPTSDITLQLTQAGDSVSGTSTVIGGGVTYTGSVSGTVNGGTVVLAGSAIGPAGNTYSSWTDERCALESRDTLKCLNPMNTGGSLTLLDITFVRG